MSSTSPAQQKTPLSRFVLILINTCFVAAGIFVIIYGVKLNDSGWFDVFKEDLPWIQTCLFAGMIALGCTMIAIAGIGCIGASFKKKGCLCCYNSFVVLAFILVFLVMAGAFASMYLANDMSGKSYPGASLEPSIADSFNQVYCYAEAVYLCNAVPAKDMLNYLIPGQVPDQVASALESYEGLNDVCNSEQADFLLSVMTDSQVKDALASACEECKKAEKYNKYEAVYTWVDEQCPLTEAGTGTISWCKNFLFEGEKGEPYDGAPYETCRTEFLGIWSTASKNIGIGMVAFLVFLLVAITSACIMTRRRSRVGTTQDKASSDEGIEVKHGEHRQGRAAFQSDEEQQQAQHYGVTVY